MTTDNKTLTTAWQEVADGAAVMSLVSGAIFWVYNGPSAPTDDTNYMPVDKYYSYSGTEKTFAKVPYSNTQNPTIIAATPIL